MSGRRCAPCPEAALGSCTGCEAVIVGAGRLGLALLDFGGFAEYGIHVPCAFDRAPSDDPRILPMESLASYCRLHRSRSVSSRCRPAPRRRSQTARYTSASGRCGASHRSACASRRA